MMTLSDIKKTLSFETGGGGKIFRQSRPEEKEEAARLTPSTQRKSSRKTFQISSDEPPRAASL
ncbi:MAG TPA: hypothetical protein VNQ90_10740 [Chthoniobacteraceae bacterium]|nr:hypothetical protein [Chthoniobacteraceae bacterium]